MNKDDYLAPKYQEMLRGINITPEQKKTLLDLYNRSTIPAKPFVGALVANTVFCIYSFEFYERTLNKEILNLFIAVLLAQFAAVVVYSAKMLYMEKQLRNKIDEIRKQNNR